MLPLGKKSYAVSFGMYAVIRVRLPFKFSMKCNELPDKFFLFVQSLGPLGKFMHGRGPRVWSVSLSRYHAMFTTRKK